LSDVYLVNEHSDVNADDCNNCVSTSVGAARLRYVPDSTMYELNLGPVSDE
jgi:hypothetical protein